MCELKFVEVKVTRPYVNKGFTIRTDCNGVCHNVRSIEFTQEFYEDGKKIYSQRLLNCMVGNEV